MSPEGGRDPNDLVRKRRGVSGIGRDVGGPMMPERPSEDASSDGGSIFILGTVLAISSAKKEKKIMNKV